MRGGLRGGTVSLEKRKLSSYDVCTYLMAGVEGGLWSNQDLAIQRMETAHPATKKPTLSPSREHSLLLVTSLVLPTPFCLLCPQDYLGLPGQVLPVKQTPIVH